MISLDRRHFCSLSTLALVGMPGTLLASTAKQSQYLEAALVLYREGNPAAREFAELMMREGRRASVMEADLVRQWRRGLGAYLNEGGVLMGYSDWDDWLLVRGLAAEQRRFPLHEAQLGPSLFSWIIG
ncbi:MAG TPA: hypothetical protein GX696_03235 [Pseudomonadaceae bacterium]|nr:hypothetical protein [Pseudomonadaceae bacterium]